MKNISFILSLVTLVAFGCKEEIGVIGCTDELAYNFNPDAEVDNGNCQYIEGCTDPAALNYNEYAVIMDGSCVYMSGCTDPDAANFNPDATIDDGSCVYDPAECGNVSTLTFDGYTYDLVAIGDQCWFAENLRTEYYTNGDAIPASLTAGEWESTTIGAVAVYDDEASNLAEYGRLYNWYAVDDARGLCPTGWHVPTDGEWMTLEMELGMSESEANDIGGRGTDQGTQMKTTYGWYQGGNGTNSSGFSGLPGGFRGTGGYFNGAGSSGIWWSSSPGGSFAWFRSLGYDLPSVNRNGLYLRTGFSVRCLRDAE